jgi:hypothetical protein
MDWTSRSWSWCRRSDVESPSAGCTWNTIRAPKASSAPPRVCSCGSGGSGGLRGSGRPGPRRGVQDGQPRTDCDHAGLAVPPGKSVRFTRTRRGRPHGAERTALRTSDRGPRGRPGRAEGAPVATGKPVRFTGEAGGVGVARPRKDRRVVTSREPRAAERGIGAVHLSSGWLRLDDGGPR